VSGLALGLSKKRLLGRRGRDARELADRGEAQLAIAKQLADQRQVDQRVCHAQPLVRCVWTVVELALHVLEHRGVAKPAVQPRLLGLEQVPCLFCLECHPALRDRTQPPMQLFPVRLADRLQGRFSLELDRTLVEHRSLLVSPRTRAPQLLSRDFRALWGAICERFRGRRRDPRVVLANVAHARSQRFSTTIRHAFVVAARDA